MVTFGDAREFGTRVYRDFSEKNVTFIAAGLAYNAFVSLAPLLLLLFVVLSVVGGGLEQRVVETAEAWLPGPIADIVAQLFAGDAAAGGASVVGLVVLVWGALKIFRGLDTAFSGIYETESDNGFTDKLRDGVVVMGALVVAVLATVGVSAAVAVSSDTVPLLGLVTPLVLVAGLVLAFFPMYYVFPDADLGWADVLPGTVFAAVGWAAFQSLFQVYLAFSDPGSSSFFGGVIVVVTYLYFTALVLLLGAVINAVRGDHASGRPGGVGVGVPGVGVGVSGVGVSACPETGAAGATMAAPPRATPKGSRGVPRFARRGAAVRASGPVRGPPGDRSAGARSLQKALSPGP